MEDKIKITCKVLEPRIDGNGRIISPEVLDKAIKEYMSNTDTKLVHMDRGTDINPFLLVDAVGTLDHIERKEDDSFTADCTIYSNTPKGKIMAEAIEFPEIVNKGFTVEPQGYYDKENENFTIVGYSIKID
jgi:hypothetical protein